jgi:hypothetical protein
MPPYVDDINYFQTGSIIRLDVFTDPKTPIDTETITADERENMKQDENGNYYLEKSASFQHKPYQYYVAILKRYFPKEYNDLTLLYLSDPEE